jgi:hypothetical protein
VYVGHYSALKVPAEPDSIGMMIAKIAQFIVAIATFMALLVGMNAFFVFDIVPRMLLGH